MWEVGISPSAACRTQPTRPPWRRVADPQGLVGGESAAGRRIREERQPGDTVNYANTSEAAANDSVTVTATRQAPTYFTKIFGFIGVTITATARATVSSFTTVHSNQDIMPWGVMKGTYTPGQSYEIYTDNSSSNNGALSLPYVNNANCPVPNGANPYRDEIDGTLNACPVSVGEQLDVKPGKNAGPTRPRNRYPHHHLEAARPDRPDRRQRPGHRHRPHQ